MSSFHVTRTGMAHPGRVHLAGVIAPRPRVNLALGLVLALGFTLLVTPIVMADTWLVTSPVKAGEPAPATIRVKTFPDGSAPERGGSVVVAAGEIPTPAQASLAEAARRGLPRGLPAFAAYAAVLF